MFSVSKADILSFAFWSTPSGMFLFSPALTEAENSLAAFASSWARILSAECFTLTRGPKTQNTLEDRRLGDKCSSHVGVKSS